MTYKKKQHDDRSNYWALWLTKPPLQFFCETSNANPKYRIYWLDSAKKLQFLTGLLSTTKLNNSKRQWKKIGADELENVYSITYLGADISANKNHKDCAWMKVASSSLYSCKHCCRTLPRRRFTARGCTVWEHRENEVERTEKGRMRRSQCSTLHQ